MEKAVVKIQSAVRGHNVRKNFKEIKKGRNTENWKFRLSGSLYKNSSFGIVEDYFQGISKSPARKSLKEIIPKAFNSIQSSKTEVFPALKKPLISIFQHDSKSSEIKRMQPIVTSPLRVKQTISRPDHFSISPQKSPRQSGKTAVVLFKYSLEPDFKPVVPLQASTTKPGRREKFVKQINEITLKFQKDEPKLSRPMTHYSAKKPEKVEIRKAVTARNKFKSNDKCLILTPDTTSRGFNSHKMTGNNPESGFVSAPPGHLEYKGSQIKLTSPYQSVWPQKLLLQYYNMKLYPSGNPGTKRFKLVKVNGNKKKNKASAELFDQYLKFY